MKTEIKKLLPMAVPTVLVLAGVYVINFLPSYSFTGYILFGLAALSLAFILLGDLKNPRTAKLCRLALVALVCVGLVAAAATGYIVYQGSLPSPDTDCEFIIVLGAGLRGSEPSLILTERLNAAYDYLVAHEETICIVSGGQGPGEEVTEAFAMYKYLVNKGIHPDRVWMETSSTSTSENIRFSLNNISMRYEQIPVTIGIVTSDFHMYRACGMLKDLGLTPVAIPAHTSRPTLQLNYYLREIAAVWYYTIFGG